tara:strand:+ start:9329 stop:10846 length:1518 start_codon:yes stop_codon:yes gene_type:complete
MLSFFIAGSLFAQEKRTKVSQSIKVDKEVAIDLNTSYTNIIFDTWNKNVVEVEAYIEGKNLSKEELQDALKSWNVDIDASTNNVSISTEDNTPHVWASNYSHNDNNIVKVVLEELKFELADLPEIIGESLGLNFEIPTIPDLPEMPEMPELPKLPEGVNNIHFDYGAYQEEGEKYLEEYTKKFEKMYGDDYAKKMEAWGEKFGKEWGEKYGKDMEAWGKKFGEKFNGEDYAKKMEAWGERFAAQMERQAEMIEAQVERTQAQKERVAEQKERILAQKELIEKQHEAHAKEREKLADKRRVLVEKLVNKESHSKVKKTIKIKMPKGAKLKVNVRHGELEFAANIDNLKANLSYTKFTANSINGSSTSINASYSPVYVAHWNLGELNLKYVKKAELRNVKNMVLNSNSSNVTIDNLSGNAIIDGSIGDLKILEIDDAFINLNIIIQNSDAIIVLPKVSHNLQYKGAYSTFYHPKNKSGKNVSSFSNNNLESNKTIVVNAKYSNITMN